MRIKIGLFAVLLSMGTLGAAQDVKSPDLQQQRHDQNTPPPQATAPGTNQQLPGSPKPHTKTRKKRAKSRRRSGSSTTTSR